MKFSTNIHCAQMMNPTKFGDSLTFPQVPSSGQNFTLTSTLVYDLRCTFNANQQMLTR